MYIHHKAILSFVHLYLSEFGNKSNQVSVYETEKKNSFARDIRVWLIFFQPVFN